MTLDQSKADAGSPQPAGTELPANWRMPQRKATLRLAQHHLTYISIAVVAAVVIPLIWGIYRSFLGFKAQRDTVIAQDNLHAIYSAMTSGYTEDHDGHLPPAAAWTDEITGYLSAPPNKPGGKLGYLRGPGDTGEVGYVYNDLASNYDFAPRSTFGAAAEAGRKNRKHDQERIDPSRLIVLIEQPGAPPNAHMSIPPPDSIQNQQELYKLLAFPHNHDDPDGARTVILYASGKIDIVTRKDLRP
jgi:hypothetical protein